MHPARPSRAASQIQALVTVRPASSSLCAKLSERHPMANILPRLFWCLRGGCRWSRDKSVHVTRCTEASQSPRLAGFSRAPACANFGDKQSLGLTCADRTFNQPKIGVLEIGRCKRRSVRWRTPWHRDSPSRLRRKEFSEDNLCAKVISPTIIDLTMLASPHRLFVRAGACRITYCFSTLVLMKQFQRGQTGDVKFGRGGAFQEIVFNHLGSADPRYSIG